MEDPHTVNYISLSGDTVECIILKTLTLLQVRCILKCFEAEFLSANPKNVRGGRLLCLDGGGIRGLILVTILLHLEAAVGQPIIHCFDWVAGTSTGAILALGLAAGMS